MEFDYSRTIKPYSTAMIALKTVYVLHADPSYDVKRTDTGREGYVALRTIAGSGSVTLEGCEPKTVTANTLLFFEFNKIKRYFCDSEVWDFWWFEFSLNGSLNLPLNNVLNIDIVDNELNDCITCLEALRKNDMASKVLASAALSLLLYKWMLHFQYEKHKTNPHQDAIDKVIAYMHSHLSENVSISVMADIAGLSERRFRQVFEDATGRQPKRFYDLLRISMAEELLNNTSMSISDIAYKLGYSSQFHFARDFKKFRGVPPTIYRQNNIKKLII